jgi:phospholipase C
VSYDVLFKHFKTTQFCKLIKLFLPFLGESNNSTFIQTKSEAQPIGLGFRVPAIIISPWTRGKLITNLSNIIHDFILIVSEGNIVVSEIFDHTSVIRLLETRFNFTTNNISPWRRAMTGDLTSFFDFEHPDYSWPELPDTSQYAEVFYYYFYCLYK